MPPPLPLDDAISEVLDVHLGAFVPGSGGSLPANSVQMVSVSGRRLGLGNRRGAETRLGRPVAALRGIYLDGTARIELWDSSPNAVDTGMEAVQANVMGARASLRSAGFLQLSVSAGSPTEHVAPLNAWRKTTDFPFLYEYRANDADDAESFIVRVPIRSDLEEPGSPEGVTETATDDMRRWDNEAAPSLIVRRSGGAGPVRATGISAFAFLPGGFSGGVVTLERGVAGAAGAPVVHATLDGFLDAVGDGSAPQTQSRVSFASVTDFLTALGPPGAPFHLGDWDSDSVSDLYLPHQRLFGRSVTLRTGRDFFAIRHDAPEFSSPAVLYLRVEADHQRVG